MMKHVFFAALAVAALASCSNQDEVTDDIRTPMAVSASIDTGSRAMVNGNDFGRAGVQIGVSLFDQATGQNYGGNAQGCVNVLYESSRVSSGAGERTAWSSSSAIVLTPTKGKAVAYYPYAAGTDITAIPVSTANQVDYMYSNWVTDITAMKPQAAFKMNHALSAVQLQIRKENYPFTGKVQSISISSKGFGTAGKLDAKTGVISGVTGVGSPVTYSTPFTLNTVATDCPLMVVPSGSTPQNLDISVVVDGKSYQASGTMNTPFAQGNVYQFPLVLRGEGLSVAQVTIVPWKDEPIFNGDLGKPVN